MRHAPRPTNVLFDRRVMGIYAGMSPVQAARKLIEIFAGDRAKAHQVAHRRHLEHEDREVVKWWEQVATAIETWADKREPEPAA